MNVDTKSIIEEINKQFDELSQEMTEKFDLLDEKLDTRWGEVDNHFERKFADLKIQQDLRLGALEKADAGDAAREERIGP
jgi:hypothetical protein